MRQNVLITGDSQLVLERVHIRPAEVERVCNVEKVYGYEKAKAELSRKEIGLLSLKAKLPENKSLQVLKFMQAQNLAIIVVVVGGCGSKKVYPKGCIKRQAKITSSTVFYAAGLQKKITML